MEAETEATRTIKRLRNTGASTQFRVEVHSGLAQEACEAQALRWWSSGGTVAMVVLTEEGVVDSAYERPWLDPSRVPPEWTHATAAKKSSATGDPTPASKPTPVRMAPTVANTPAAKRQPGGCGTCFQATTTAARRTDSPSEMLAQHRCPTCGMPSREGAGVIWQRYMRSTTREPTGG